MEHTCCALVRSNYSYIPYGKAEKMFVIAGGSGRVGSAAASALIEGGHEVRILVRRQEAAESWLSRGAQARVLDLRDRQKLADALRGTRGMFALLPFDLTAADLDQHARSVVEAIAGAVRDAEVPHVVALSSGGAHLSSGTGPIAGLHLLEQALRATPAVITALRSGHFQEKVDDVIDVAETTGTFPVFASSADQPLPQVATRDLGGEVAGALSNPPQESEVVDVLGPEYTEREVAHLLGQALGQDLAVELVPPQAWPGAMQAAGFPAHVAQSLAELYRADDHGLLAPRGDRTVRGTSGLATTINQLVTANKRRQ